MLVIRLARTGRAKYPTYRIVAAESSRAATGKFVEVLGHYNPHTKELSIKKEETLKRLGNGAQPSNTVVKLLQREKVELPDWVKLKTKSRKPKNEPEEKPEAAPAEAAVEPVAGEAEAPVALAAEENAEATETNAEPMGQTETAEANEEKAEAAEEASDAAAESAEASADTKE